MKKIVNGKLYNTATAERIGEYTENYPGDFNYYIGVLYRTKNGTYFLYEYSGPMSSTCYDPLDNSWRDDENITILSDSAAYEWAVDYLDPDDVLEIWPCEEG